MIKKIDPPNKTWRPDEPTVSPVKGWVSLNLSDMDTLSKYKLLIGSVVPRPIAFVSTIDAKGNGNLAPFSFFNGVSTEPLAIMFSVTQKSDGSDKDTWKNIRETKEFVVNSVNEWMIQAVNQCSAEYPNGVNEMKEVGLTAIASETIKPPRVKESSIQMECKLYNFMQVGKGGPGSAHVIVGEVLKIHIDKDAYHDGKIDLEKLKPISRLAGFGYGKTTEMFEIPRPKL